MLRFGLLSITILGFIQVVNGIYSSSNVLNYHNPDDKAWDLRNFINGISGLIPSLLWPLSNRLWAYAIGRPFYLSPSVPSTDLSDNLSNSRLVLRSQLTQMTEFDYCQDRKRSTLPLITREGHILALTCAWKDCRSCCRLTPGTAIERRGRDGGQEGHFGL